MVRRGASSPASMDTFTGKFERTEQSNYEEFLKVNFPALMCIQVLGVNFILRKAALISTPIVEVG